jgi:hypothetical protein
VGDVTDGARMRGVRVREVRLREVRLGRRSRFRGLLRAEATDHMLKYG